MEVRELIERERLFGLGYGLVDLTLLASTMLTTGARLWPLDQRLASWLSDSKSRIYRQGIEPA
jgi:hypothetical protein